MRVIVHYPETEQGRSDLARMVAETHAQLVIERLKSGSFPAEQKKKMIAVLQGMERK